MRVLLSVCFSLAALVAACGAPPGSAPAHDERARAALTVQDAWAAPTPAGVDVAAGYATISNGTNVADHLLSASSPRAERVEIHEMSMDGAVMQMRMVERLEIPARGEVQLNPGGMHFMFSGVTAPFEAGQTIPVRLVFESAGTLDIDLPVGQPGAHDHND